MTPTAPAAARTPVAEKWRTAARAVRPRIALADGADERVRAAAERLEREGLAVPLLVDDPVGFCSPAVRAAGRDLTVAGTDRSARPSACGRAHGRGRRGRGLCGWSTRPTPDVVRAALFCVGTAAGVDLVSSCFLFVLTNGDPIVYGDCGVVPEPDAAQLASIAVASAATYAQLTGDEPRVAMLSYSTKGSAQGPQVELVQAATELVQSKAPGLAVDGELQFDAAWEPEVAAAKAPGSPVAGRANVFVFPDLSSGTSHTRSPSGSPVPRRTDLCYRALPE